MREVNPTTKDGHLIVKPLEMKVVATGPIQTLEISTNMFINNRHLHEARPEVLAQQDMCRNRNQAQVHQF